MEVTNGVWEDIVSTLGHNHIPELFLVVIGLLVIALAVSFVKDDDSKYYKGIYVVSVAVAAITVILVATGALPIAVGPAVVLIIGCFTLLSRPFRKSHIAVLLGLFVLAIAYLALTNVKNVDFLGDFWVRFVIALIVAGLVYALASFVENVVVLFGKLLNWWPMMIAVGLICLMDAALIYTGNESIVTWIMHSLGH